MTTVKQTPTMRFSAADVVLGSTVTVVTFVLAVTTIIFTLFSLIGALALGASSGDNRTSSSNVYPGPGGDQSSALSDLFSSVLGILVLVAIVAICVAVVTLLVTAVFGPLSALLAVALRRVPAWPIHVLAYFALGGIASTCVALVAVPLLDYSWTNVWPIAGILDLLAAGSASVGWAVAWRVAIRRNPRVSASVATAPDRMTAAQA